MPSLTKTQFVAVISIILLSRPLPSAFALSSVPVTEPNWTEAVAPNGRANPYGLPVSELSQSLLRGKKAALHYPMTKTGILLPYQPLQNFLKSDSHNPLRVLVEKIFSGLSHFSSMNDVETWLGLPTYPSAVEAGPFEVPRDLKEASEHHMGFTLIETPSGLGFTISCAQCHTSSLFGRRIIGGATRFPRANEFFSSGLQLAPFVGGSFFQISTGASAGETAMFRVARESMKYVAARTPVQLGLDTSLTQVALSLAKRAPDAWASRSSLTDGFIESTTAVSQSNELTKNLTDYFDRAQNVADSKPAVWWNVKYKNRWLSDGSVVSGNPVITNFLWNEIGRGTDLHDLSNWLSENAELVRDLTATVFATQAPRYTDFFSRETSSLNRAENLAGGKPELLIDENLARAGEPLFQMKCAHCHGSYEKAWALPNAAQLNSDQRLETTSVHYSPQTHAVDVGTDPGRYLGMQALERLNDLQLSKDHGVVVMKQQGYVPPPLVGIWARWPYFHNNSAPTLCAVLTKSSLRPKSYVAREAVSPEQDFDAKCNGYPQAAATAGPAAYIFDTRRPGLSNAGHDEGIFIENGQETLTVEQKMALIEFLKTL